MNPVKSIEVSSSHKFLAMQSPSSQGMVVDDVSYESPLIWEQSIVPLDKGELLRCQGILVLHLIVCS